MSTLNETLSESMKTLFMLVEKHKTADKETRNIIQDDLDRLEAYIDELTEVNKAINRFIKSLKKQYNVK